MQDTFPARSLESVSLPDREEWRRLARQLERRAQALRDPLAVARQHFQRAEVLQGELGDAEGARSAWLAALEAWPGHLPAFLALRDFALQQDDQPLAEHLFEHALDHFTRSLDARDAGEVFGAFVLLWLFRWRDPTRAEAALAASGSLPGLSRELEPLLAHPDRRALRLREALDRADSERRAGIASELGRVLLDELGQPAAAMPLLEEAAALDPTARWRLVEGAAREGRTADLARHLEALGDALAGPVSAALRFIAGELYEFVLEAPAKAMALYDDVRSGSLLAVVGLKRVLAVVSDPGAPSAELAARLADEAEQLGELGLDRVLATRAAELYAAAGDDVATEATARMILARYPDARGAHDALLRLLWRDRRWPELEAALRSHAPLDRSRRLVMAAVQEHALRDVDGARAALGDPGALARGGGAEALILLRTLQRLHMRARPTERVRAWQYEADTHESNERRAHLYLRIGSHFLKHTVEQEKGLTYLFWVLDHDPENLTALRLIEFVSRSRNSHRPLMEILARELTLLDRPGERFPLERELARLLEGPGGDPQRAVELYEAALADRPGDPDTVADLARIYHHLGRPQDLAALLEGLLRLPVTLAERVRLLVRLGELYEDERVREPRRARRRYAEVVDSVKRSSEALSGDIAVWIARAEAGLERLGGAPSVADRATTTPLPEEEIQSAPTFTPEVTDPGRARLEKPEGEASLGALLHVLAAHAPEGPDRTPWPGEARRMPPLPRSPSGDGEVPAAGMRGAGVRSEGRRTMDGGWSRTPEPSAKRRPLPAVPAQGTPESGTREPRPAAGTQARSGQQAPEATGARARRSPKPAAAGGDEDEEPAPDSGPAFDIQIDLDLNTDSGILATSTSAVSSIEPLSGHSIGPAATRGLTTAPPAAPAPEAPDDDEDEPTIESIPPGGDAEPRDAVAPFLGEERQRTRDEDPARAVVARKLKRAHGGAPEWPDLGDDAARAAAQALAQAGDEDARVRAAAALARRYEAIEAFEEAARAWRTVLSWRAGEAEAVDRLAALCRRIGDWRGLAEMRAREVETTADRERKRGLLLEVAALHAGPLGDPGAAVPFYREALRHGPASADVMEPLGQALRDAGRWEELAALLADTLDESDAEQKLALGRVHLYRLGAPEAAAGYIRDAAAALPGRADVAADLAEVEAAQGDLETALARLDAAIERTPGEEGAALRLRRARLLEERSLDPERARAAWRDAVRAGVSEPAVLDRLEQLAVEARDWPTLADVLERRLTVARAGNLAPDALRDLVVRLGHLYYKRLDRPHEAAQRFLEAYELRPSDTSLYRVVEGILTRNPVPSLQIRLYEAHLAHGEHGSRREQIAAASRLAAAYEAGGQPNEAIARFEALRGSSDEAGAALERLYQAHGRWHDLVALFRERLEGRPDDLALLRRLAHALEVGLRDLPAATDVWQRIHALAPDDAAAVRAQTRLLEAQKRWEELLALSAKELAGTEDRRHQAHVHFRMGSLRETQMRDASGARAEYRKALQLDPRCFPALHGLREIAAAAEDWPEVVRWLEQEVRLWDEPRERSAVLARVAEVYESKLSDRETALAFYRRAIATFPACVPAARALAEDAFAQGRWSDAAPYFQVISHQNLEKWPRAERADVFYKRGVVALNLGRLIEASECLKIALEVHPAHAGALHALIRAWAGHRRDAAFDELMTRLDEQYAAHGRAGATAEQSRIDVLRGYAAEQTLDLEAAARHYERAAALLPEDLEALRPLVDLHLKMRRWDAAAGALRTFSDRLLGSVQTPAARRMAVAALTWEGEIGTDFAVDPGRALACYRRVLELDPGDRNARFQIAQCHFLQNDFDRARQVMVELLAICTGEDVPASEQALYTFYLGRVHQTGLQQPEAASAHYRTALDLDPRCAPALLALLRVLHGLKNPESLEALLRRHLPTIEQADAADPAVAALKTFAARALLAGDDEAGARRMLGALSERPGPGRRDARFALSRIHRQRGETDQAAAQLFRLVDENVCDLTALRALGEVFDSLGDEERVFQVLGALEVYRALTPEEQARFQKLEERARRTHDKGGKPLAEELVTDLLVHPSWHSPVVPLIRVCDAELARRYPLRPRPDLRDATPVDGRKHPLWFDFKSVQGLLGPKSVELYVASDEHAPIAVWPGEKTLVVLGDATPWSAAERRFLLGRALGHCRAGLGRLHDLETERALDLLALLEGLFTPRASSEIDPEDFLASLPKKVADAVGQVVDAAVQGTLPALYTGESVLVGLTHTFDRVGLLAGGLLRPAVESLARVESGVDAAFAPGSDLTWAVRSRPRLQELVKYALSEPYHRLRRAAGLAI